MRGLLLRPDSLYRGTQLRKHPPQADPAGPGQVDRLDWYGFDQTTALLLRIYNLLAVRNGKIRPPRTVAPSPVETEVAHIRHIMSGGAL